MQLIVETNGWIRMIYDEVIDLGALGTRSIRRASHVEPAASGRWLVNLAPVNGPQLGPFDQRSVAIETERAWLELHWLV